MRFVCITDKSLTKTRLATLIGFHFFSSFGERRLFLGHGYHNGFALVLDADPWLVLYRQ